MRISDWSSDVCSSDLGGAGRDGLPGDDRQPPKLCPRPSRRPGRAGVRAARTSGRRNPPAIRVYNYTPIQGSGGGVMAKGGNSLEAVLNRAKADGDAAPAPAPAIEPVDVSRKAPPSGRQGTKLIGG